MPDDLGLVEAMLDPTLTVGECEAAAAKADRTANRQPHGDGEDTPGDGIPVDPPHPVGDDPG